jgi:hypothetical protein
METDKKNKKEMKNATMAKGWDDKKDEMVKRKKTVLRVW